MGVVAVGFIARATYIIMNPVAAFPNLAQTNASESPARPEPSVLQNTPERQPSEIQATPTP